MILTLTGETYSHLQDGVALLYKVMQDTPTGECSPLLQESAALLYKIM